MTEVLLAYAPHAADADVTEALCLSLASAAVRDGEADPLLVPRPECEIARSSAAWLPRCCAGPIAASTCPPCAACCASRILTSVAALPWRSWKRATRRRYPC